MRETITRCSICKREDCDGQEYEAQYVAPYTGEKVAKIVCTSQTYGREGSDKRYYDVICGHGLTVTGEAIIETVEVDNEKQKT